MRILGISAFYHDSAAALVVDGEIVAAAQEERFTRRKHDAGFPTNAVNYCLAQGNLKLSELDHIAFYDKPFLKFERLLETYVAFAPRGFRSFQMALPLWIKEKLFQKDGLARELSGIEPGHDWAGKLLFAEHHLSHAASAFYPSPFEEALVLTLDGVGEWCTTSAGLGSGADLAIHRELHFPHSLGLLYSAFTYYTGFKVNSGEYKVMGLAPYGEPKYAGAHPRQADGPQGRRQLPPRPWLLRLLHRPDHDERQVRRAVRRARAHTREAADPVPHGHRRFRAGGDRGGDAAADALARRARPARRTSASPAAWRSTASPTARCCATAASRSIWIQPAAGDAGGALGAALSAYYLHAGKPRVRPANGDSMRGAYLGPSFTQEEIERRLEAAGARFETVPEADMIARTAADLAAGKAVGWFQGRMEFGPRALGARSILGDARSPSMQKTLNLRVKYRESFRPFAPSVLREEVGRLVRARRGLPLHAAGGRRRARAPPRHDGRGAGAVRHRQAQRRRAPRFRP